ncbi:tetratricopeptide repeat protein, partial [Moraxella osloensis]
MNTKHLLVYSLLATLTTPAFADITTTPDPTVFFDKDPQVKPDLLLNQPKIATPTVAPVASDNTLETRINAAIMGKDWVQLEQLLKQYQQVADKDQTLYDYGLGALYRHQGKQKQAIALYRQILARQPDLH